MPGILAKRVLSTLPDDYFVPKRHKALATLSDEYAWDYEPQELIDAAKDKRMPPTYPHYRIRVDKVMGLILVSLLGPTLCFISSVSTTRRATK
ncbi:hypothetical protein RSAG8_08875, partial [Rhizoctonia solani AG-8 WAC10335]